MKILHVCQLYHPSVGGNQFHIQSLSERLARLGDEVHVFTANAMTPGQFTNEDKKFTPLPAEETVNGVRVRRFAVNHGLRRLVFEKIYRMRGGYRGVNTLLGQTFDFWKDGPLVPQMLGAIRRLKPDLVVAVMNYSYTTYVCYLAKKLFGFKLAVMPITHISNPKTFHPFLKVIYRSADLVTACTEFEKKHLLSQGVAAEKIVTWPLGIDVTGFAGQNGEAFRAQHGIGPEPVVAYIGRKVTNKGIEALMEAMPDVWKEFPDAKLLLAGETRSDTVPVIQKILAGYTTEEKARVILLEGFSDEEKKHIFAGVDLVAMASRIDCFGMVYLEAWLSGKPVIACKNTAQESIIDDGLNGLLVEYGNAGDTARAVKKLLKDKNLRERMGEAGREKARTVYNLDTYALTVQKGYYEIN